jgi:hypothetical protein
VPRDVTKVPIGPDALIQTDGRVGRVPLDVPPAVFTIEEQMQEEVFTASRHPKVRAGESDASVITGRGVAALLGEFDAQIKSAQLELGNALSEATSICFQMDETWFPKVERTIRGTLSGESYQETFNPAKDIAGNYECDVTYGFAAGLTPAQATVLMLQLRNDQLISRDTFRRNGPVELDLETEQIHVDQEEMRDSIKRGIDALGQAIPAMIQQGMDPTQIITAMSNFIKLRSLRSQSLRVPQRTRARVEWKRARTLWLRSRASRSRHLRACFSSWRPCVTALPPFPRLSSEGFPFSETHDPGREWRYRAARSDVASHEEPDRPCGRYLGST